MRAENLICIKHYWFCNWISEYVRICEARALFVCVCCPCVSYIAGGRIFTTVERGKEKERDIIHAETQSALISHFSASQASGNGGIRRVLVTKLFRRALFCSRFTSPLPFLFSFSSSEIPWRHLFLFIPNTFRFLTKTKNNKWFRGTHIHTRSEEKIEIKHRDFLFVYLFGVCVNIGRECLGYAIKRNAQKQTNWSNQFKFKSKLILLSFSQLSSRS